MVTIGKSSTSRISGYIPGMLLFFVAAIVGLLVYQDYGISWDEPVQRMLGTVTYNYAFHHDQALLTYPDRQYGSGFELLLTIFEKCLHLPDTRDIFLMRHLVTHLLFLLGCLAAYLLTFRLFQSRAVAFIAFLMLLLHPRLYAHSFFNSKDIPILSVLVIAVTLCHVAFTTHRKWFFVLAGIASGYATSVRVVGAMPFVFTASFLLFDLLLCLWHKQKCGPSFLRLALMSLTFCFTLYVCWPWLWQDPLHRLLGAFAGFSHYEVGFPVLFRGASIPAMQLPPAYFPVWFSISNPPLWLISGGIGLLVLLFDIVRRPAQFFNMPGKRIFIVVLLCFALPILAIFLLHSIIYDDWRHLYFVYPFFVFATLYGLHKLIHTRLAFVVYTGCFLQFTALVVFMIRSHPFQQVYFNGLVSHSPQYLRNNFELDYWGASYKQAVDHLLANARSPVRIAGDSRLVLENNLLLLSPSDKVRIIVGTPEESDYFITTFRFHPSGYPYPDIIYSRSVLGSTMLCIYKLR